MERLLSSEEVLALTAEEVRGVGDRLEFEWSFPELGVVILTVRGLPGGYWVYDQRRFEDHGVYRYLKNLIVPEWKIEQALAAWILRREVPG